MVLDAITHLTHFQPMFHFYTAWKHQKTSGFLFWGGYISGSLVENRLKSMLSTKRENKKTVNWFTLQRNCLLMDCVNIDCKGAKKMQLRKFKGALSGPRQVFATESPLKMMKNALYFTSKALFVLKILKFLSGLLVMRKSGLRKKVRLISKFVT